MPRYEPETDDDDLPMIDCPHCGASIYEEAEQCPKCGQYVSEEDEDTPPSRKPLWIVVAALLCLYAVYRWIVG